MSRRDTIIIAVLANAGLLAILFMMAINSNDDKLSDQSEISATFVEAKESASQEPQQVVLIADATTTTGDEVDNVLKELNTGSEQSLQQPLVEESISSQKTSSSKQGAPS